jgi:hypothetical protein
MSEFRTVLELRLLPRVVNSQENIWMVISPLVYWSDSWQREITVEPGFITNLLSFFALKGVAAAESVLHDYLCSCDDVVLEQANRIFAEALKAVSGFSELEVAPLYDAINDFGASHKANIYHLG